MPRLLLGSPSAMRAGPTLDPPEESEWDGDDDRTPEHEPVTWSPIPPRFRREEPDEDVPSSRYADDAGGP